MKKYAVQQGVFSLSGVGDMVSITYFTELDYAESHYELVKSNTQGWIIPHNHVLKTELIEITNQEFDGDYEVIDGYEVSKYGVEVAR